MVDRSASPTCPVPTVAAMQRLAGIDVMSFLENCVFSGLGPRVAGPVARVGVNYHFGGPSMARY
jgi:hypothetical protein